MAAEASEILEIFGQAAPVAVGVDSSGEAELSDRDVSQGLLDALRAVCHRVCGPTIRQKALVTKLGLERSALGRIERSLREDDTLVAAASLPSPSTLRTFVTTAMQVTSVPPGEATRAMDSIAAYEALLAAHPDGRRAVQRRAVRSSPARRGQVDGAARRMLYQTAAELLGVKINSVICTMAVLPSKDDPARLDTLHVQARYGVSRLREDVGPTTLFMLRGGPAMPRTEIQMVGSESVSDHARDFLLSEHCRGHVALELSRSAADSIQVRLAANSPALNSPASVVSAYWVPKMLRRYSDESFEYEWYEAMVRVPCKRMTIDLMIHKDVHLGGPVLTSSRLFTHPVPVMPTRGLGCEAQHDRVPSQMESTILDRAVEEVQGVSGYAEMLAGVMAKRGLDCSQFRTLRFTSVAPVLMSSNIIWLPLEAPPVARRAQ
jgi:hypothetical protein